MTIIEALIQAIDIIENKNKPLTANNLKQIFLTAQDLEDKAEEEEDRQQREDYNDLDHH